VCKRVETVGKATCVAMYVCVNGIAEQRERKPITKQMYVATYKVNGQSKESKNLCMNQGGVKAKGV